MQRVTFSKDFDHRAGVNTMVAYKKGETYSIPETAFEAAKAAGAIESATAVRVNAPVKEMVPVEAPTTSSRKGRTVKL
ncbi:MAG TPA: hypothetical protein VGU45_04970 [Microvirga sp.]|jgi:hypothetical protein|nr:hypothetical protein [Microvirga sp.]